MENACSSTPCRPPPLTRFQATSVGQPVEMIFGWERGSSSRPAGPSCPGNRSAGTDARGGGRHGAGEHGGFISPARCPCATAKVTRSRCLPTAVDITDRPQRREAAGTFGNPRCAYRTSHTGRCCADRIRREFARGRRGGQNFRACTSLTSIGFKGESNDSSGSPARR